MKKIFIILLIFLLVTPSHAQEGDCNLFGETYTYMWFRISEKDSYPILFSALTKVDSLDVDLTDFDSFVKSVYSTCEFAPLSIISLDKAFKAVYENTMNTLFWRTGFGQGFAASTKKYKREISFKLQTGEEVSVTYCDVTGAFLRGDKSFRSNLSIGLPEEYLVTMDEVVILVAFTDADYTNEEFHFTSKKSKVGISKER